VAPPVPPVERLARQIEAIEREQREERSCAMCGYPLLTAAVIRNGHCFCAVCGLK
jgi:ribosomal protein L37AE/L43A